MSDIPAITSFLAELDEKYAPELFVHAKNKTTLESSKAALADLHGILSGLASWDHDALMTAVKSYTEAKGTKLGPIMWPLRIALSGLAVTPTGAIEIAELLGKAESLRRMELAIKRL